MGAAEKILAKMRRTKAGWDPADFEKVYKGFGFDAIRVAVGDQR